jgi:hypothetical protein
VVIDEPADAEMDSGDDSDYVDSSSSDDSSMDTSSMASFIDDGVHIITHRINCTGEVEFLRETDSGPAPEWVISNYFCATGLHEIVIEYLKKLTTPLSLPIERLMGVQQIGPGKEYLVKYRGLAIPLWVAHWMIPILDFYVNAMLLDLYGVSLK